MIGACLQLWRRLKQQTANMACFGSCFGCFDALYQRGRLAMSGGEVDPEVMKCFTAIEEVKKRLLAAKEPYATWARAPRSAHFPSLRAWVQSPVYAQKPCDGLFTTTCEYEQLKGAVDRLALVVGSSAKYRSDIRFGYLQALDRAVEKCDEYAKWRSKLIQLVTKKAEAEKRNSNEKGNKYAVDDTKKLEEEVQEEYRRVKEALSDVLKQVAVDVENAAEAWQHERRATDRRRCFPVFQVTYDTLKAVI